MIGRITAGFRELRPRSIAQLRKSLVDSRSSLGELTATVAALNESVQALERTIHTQQAEIAAIRIRESQLRAVAERNLQMEERQDALAAVLRDPAIRSHVEEAIRCTPLRLDPFPHMVVDRLLPDALYTALIEGLPPEELFADRPPNKRQMLVPFHLAPDYSRRVWTFMADVVVRDIITPVLAEAFRAPLERWVRDSFPDGLVDPAALAQLVSSDGRILLRTQGYRIRPHRDPKWGFITCILYLARPGDDQRWGTDLYAVDEDREAKGAEPYWIDENRCRQVSTVSFRRNRALIFLNSNGAHGAAIPLDAEPPDLQRYIYQFRIGPDAASMATLTASLPPERRAFWEGKQRTY